MIHILLTGGPIMIILGMCSFYGCYIVVQKLLFFKANRIQQDAIVGMVSKQLVTIGKPAIIQNFRHSQSATKRILASSMAASDQPTTVIQETIRNDWPQAAPELNQHMAVLSSLITITPILGLLGTVIGLMDIFNVLSNGPIDDAQQLSGGIAQALITTVTGLSITIPLIIMQRIIQEKTDRYRIALDACIRDVVDLCKKTAS